MFLFREVIDPQSIPCAVWSEIECTILNGYEIGFGLSAAEGALVSDCIRNRDGAGMGQGFSLSHAG